MEGVLTLRNKRCYKTREKWGEGDPDKRSMDEGKQRKKEEEGSEVKTDG